MAETGAGVFFGGGDHHQAAGGALELAGLVLVDFEADQEFAELRVDGAVDGDRDAVAIEPELRGQCYSSSRITSRWV